MDREELRSRTKKYAVRIVTLSRSLPRTPEARVIGNQILRSATSVAANYRAACRARSRPDFLSKLSVVLEEADESLFWLEMLVETGTIRKEQLADLLKESDELVRIFSSAEHTLRSQIRTPKSQIPDQS